MKKNTRIFVACAAVVLAVSLTSAGRAATLHVPDDYSSIQAAINAATDADLVLIADGTYSGPGNRDLDFGGKAITVRSENGPNACIIDCQGSGRGFHFHSGEGLDSVLQGLTIRNGSTPGDGAGILCENAAPWIDQCVLTAGHAGGSGAGIFCTQAAGSMITHTVVLGNLADGSGGGIGCHLASPKIINCLIADNQAGGDGGGLWCYSSGSPSLSSTTVTANQAGGIGGGLYTEASEPLVANSILWGNAPQSYHVTSGGFIVRYTDIEEGYPGIGNIDQNPLFVNGPAGSHYLGVGSPCFEAGSDLAENLRYRGPEGMLPVNQLVTRADQFTDVDLLDLGYHHPAWTLDSSFSGLPASGVLPFVTTLCATVENRVLVPRTFWGRVDARIAAGALYSGLRSGSLGLSSGGSFTTCWNQFLPAMSSLVGENRFLLYVEDTTPPPQSDPPNPPAGFVRTTGCVVVGLAP